MSMGLFLVVFTISVAGALFVLFQNACRRRDAFEVLALGREAAKEQEKFTPLQAAPKKIPASSSRGNRGNRANKENREILQSLPLVMEQLLLAVQAGHDMLSALRIVLHAGGYVREDGQCVLPSPKSAKQNMDNRTLEKLVQVYAALQQGRGFEETMEELAEQTHSVPFRHALLHMIVCHREGGELVAPLRELSDASQLCYEEEVEEGIAKLPVRATPALICSFAGLLLCAMSIPMSRLLDSANMMQGAGNTQNQGIYSKGGRR